MLRGKGDEEEHPHTFLLIEGHLYLKLSYFSSLISGEYTETYFQY